MFSKDERPNSLPHEKRGSQPEFSIIITCYFEEDSIEEFYSRLAKALDDLKRTHEIVFVNDGSTDSTFEKLKAIYAKDPAVTTIIDLFRNSGQAAAITAGLVHAKGRHFVFMDSDLQLAPEELSLLIEEFDKGFDIVSGWRINRSDPFWRIFPSKLANIIMRKISKHNIRDFGCTFKVYNGTLMRAFAFGPFKRFQTAYVFAKAQRCSEIPVSHSSRKYGKSGWSLLNLFSFLMDNVVGISQRPFQLLSFLCILAAFVFFLRIIFAFFVPFKIIQEVTPGLILNVILIHLLITLATLAAIGEYTIRNFASLQDYPIYVIREIHQKSVSD